MYKLEESQAFELQSELSYQIFILPLLYYQNTQQTKNQLVKTSYLSSHEIPLQIYL